MESIVSQALSTLKCATTERVRFRLPMNATEVEAVMTQAYANIVAQRGGTIETMDASTKANIQQVSRWLTNARLRPSLIIRGCVGNGKTTTAKSIAATFDALRMLGNTKLRNDRWKMNAQEEAIYSTLSRLPVLNIMSAVDIANAARDTEKLANIKSTQILIIDDLGTEPATSKVYGTELTPITEIINHRYERMATTIITTNLNDAAIKERYGERVIDRINEMYEKLVYTSPSYRANR